MTTSMEKQPVPIKDATVCVRYGVSRNGVPYRYFEMGVKGQKVRLGFVTDRAELQLLRAGIELEEF